MHTFHSNFSSMHESFADLANMSLKFTWKFCHTPDIPYIQTVGFIFQSFDIEAQCRADRRDVFTVEFFQNCCFPCVVQSTKIN